MGKLFLSSDLHSATRKEGAVEKNIKGQNNRGDRGCGFSDFTKFVSLETLPERGQVMTVTDTALLNRQSAKAVASIKAGTKGIEVKLYDKLRALELLGKIYGVFGGDISEEEAVENLKKFFGEDGFGTD